METWKVILLVTLLLIIVAEVCMLAYLIYKRIKKRKDKKSV